MNIARRLSSSTLSKRVVASTSDLGGGSARPSVWWRGNSYVAAREPSDLPKKRNRRIPQEERKAMVESYVNEYRAMNSGKFPPPTEVWREVGGSYYIVRKFIQELHYQAKIDTISTAKAYSQGEVTKDWKRLSSTHQVSTSNMATYKNIRQNGQTRDENVSSKEATTISSVQLPLVVTVQEEKPIQRDTRTSPQTESAKNDESLHEVEGIQFFPSESDVKIGENIFESVASNVGSELPKETKTRESGASNVGSDLPKATNEQFIGTTLSEKMEAPLSTGDTTQVMNVIDDKIKEEAADSQQDFHKVDDNAKIQDSPELGKLEPEREAERPHQARKLETVTRDLSKHHSDDAEAGKKSNMWDNFKSFADGIFSFFRKQ
ncbi:hypothetical protein Leryth_001383 [Lithospermum erythrorhizon]|nr:hypothetical protein Leryth_001383 [Lithospermum erythrorhizon]